LIQPRQNFRFADIGRLVSQFHGFHFLAGLSEIGTVVLFLAYLFYGVLRPWLSREWRRGIEEEIGEEPVESAEQL
jgi:hypothetical protein